MSGEAQYPWITGELQLPAAVLQELHAHALECYPNECCGFHRGSAHWDAHKLTGHSVRDQRSRQVPQARSRSRFRARRTFYFKINELRAARAFDQGDKSGEPIKVIYHSHPNVGAYFSAGDALPSLRKIR